jgi:hypothetical protein
LIANLEVLTLGSGRFVVIGQTPGSNGGEERHLALVEEGALERFLGDGDAAFMPEGVTVLWQKQIRDQLYPMDERERETLSVALGGFAVRWLMTLHAGQI